VADAALGRKVRHHFGFELHEGEAVGPGADEHAKRRVGVDLRAGTGPMRAAVIRGQRLGCRKAFNTPFNGLLKGLFKPRDGALPGGEGCLQFGQGGGDEGGTSFMVYLSSHRPRV